MTSEYFAKLVGVDRTAVSHWLSNRRAMSGPAVKLCRMMDKYKGTREALEALL